MLEKALFSRHLEEDEHVSRIVHKHWLMGVKFLALPTVFFLLPWAIAWQRHSPNALLFLFSWMGLAAIWWLRNFFDYYLDAWIITDHGIIDLEWLGWFHRQSSRILYSDIQGVSTEICGVTGTLLRYGAVTVEKISTGTTVSLEYVPTPRRVESLILRNMEAYLHSKNLKNAKHIEELLSQFVAQHIGEESVKDKVRVAPKPAGNTSRPTRNSFSSMRIGSRSSP